MDIAIDVMGGDFAPLEAIKGVQLFLQSPQPDIHLTLIGKKALITPLLESYGLSENSQISVVNAEQVIEMHEHPTKALKEKTDSSISIGFYLLSAGKTDAFISAGNTGAMMVGAMFTIKPIDGVLRPTIGAYMPKQTGELALLADVGLNADCKPENLNQ
ncbi:MAG: phosphate--acyl-ACP acyltransferase, partial [Bacteroidota bacterium]|nr:phosphate--acyl-ACP acyltransferase [Bacteroidota bacterium]